MRRLAITVVGLVALWGCSRLSFLASPASQASPSPGENVAGATRGAAPFTGAALELQRIQYDGKELKGRLLVGAREQPLKLDKRLGEEVSVDVTKVLDCRTGEPVEFLIVDFFPSPPRAEDLLSLEPGQWYGAEVRFSLFDEHFTGQLGPECIDVELTVFLVEPDTVAHLRVQAMKALSSQPDAGPPPLGRSSSYSSVMRWSCSSRSVGDKRRFSSKSDTSTPASMAASQSGP